MLVHIDKPILNKTKPEENIAIIDRWMAETADKLNMFIQSVERNNNDSKDKRP